MPGALLGASWVMIEIEPLLAFQFHVDRARSDHHNGGAKTAPTLDELLKICLPMEQASEAMQIQNGPNSIMLTSRSLNLRTLARGFIGGAFLGVQVGVSLPFVHVVRHHGRYYLHNGFHRTVGLRARGATHVPCVLRDVADHAAVGLNHPGTFGPELMESANPPRLGHYTQGRATEVMLKAFHRTVHVSWCEYAVTHD